MTFSEERRLVTVLFVDLVGFTTRSEATDPEEVREIQRTYFGAVAAEVERYGGTVEKYIGDAVMAIYGAPQAPCPGFRDGSIRRAAGRTVPRARTPSGLICS